VSISLGGASMTHSAHKDHPGYYPHIHPMARPSSHIWYLE